ncbi:MAG: prepilin peptidase [Glaciihabitans sp.]|nr:prepilin peptidase [Glaciihabitans sp.]
MSTHATRRPTRLSLAWQLPLTAVLAITSALAAGFSILALPLLFLAAVTPLLVAVDAREHRLPNWLVGPAIGVGALAVAAQWATSGVLPAVPLAAAAGYSAFLFVLSRLGGMGMGDVKLAAALGLASSTSTVAILSPVVAFTTGGVVALVVLLRRGSGTRIAFGPYLLAGFWTATAVVALAAVS